MLAVLVKAFPDRGPSGIDWKAIPAESKHGPALGFRRHVKQDRARATD